MSAGLEILGGVYGGIVGVALGLTGGGGSIFAVPLLIYGLGVPARTAIALSLAVVGLTAGVGAVLHLRAREVEIRAGLVFAAAGMLVAPFGTALGRQVPTGFLLSAFAILMAFIGWRMWRGKPGADLEPGPCVSGGKATFGPGCYLRLSLAGGGAGLLSGLFGVGGGFIIVPVLLYVTGMSIHRAIATSLLVICLVSISGVAANLSAGLTIPMPVTGWFLAGGVAGMLVGGSLRSRFSADRLRRVFAVAMWVVGGYVLVRNVAGL